MNDFVEICPHCGEVFFQACRNCSWCGGTFDSTEIRARREKWLNSMKKDGFLADALKTVAEADFSAVDGNLVRAVLRCGDFEALKKIVLTGYDQWDRPELLMAAIKAPFPEMMAFLTGQGVDFGTFFKNLTAGKLYAVSDGAAPIASESVDTKAASEGLRKAVEAGDIKKAEYWLRNGGDVNFPAHAEVDFKKGIWYRDTLPMAALIVSPEMAELLVSHGAKMTDWRILPYIMEFGRQHDPRGIRYLVEHGAKYCLNDPARNLLTSAALNGSLSIFEYIHTLGFDLNNGVDKHGKTPLRIAAEWARSEILEYLLAHGARTDIGNDRFGAFSANIAKINAAETDFLKSLKVLSKFDIDIRHCELLEHAAYKGFLQVAGYLLEHGCPVEKASPDGKTLEIYPLQWCICGNSEHTIEMIDLLIAHGASVNGCRRYSGSPLREAVKKLEPAVVEKLIRCGADANLLEEGESRPILFEALYQKPKSKVLKIVKLLVENGANTHLKYLGRSPRQLAADRDLDNVAACFRERGKK